MYTNPYLLSDRSFPGPLWQPASPLSDHPLFFLILMDSVTRRSSLRFLLQLEQCAAFLNFLNVHPAVFVGSSEAEISRFCAHSRFPFLMFADEDHSIIRHFSCLQNKAVFGKSRPVFRPCLLLLEHEKVICRFRQANSSTLRNVLRKAVQIQFQALEQALLCPIDKKKSGCYDYSYRKNRISAM